MEELYIKLFIAILGVPTAIFALFKAYIELRRIIKQKGAKCL